MTFKWTLGSKGLRYVADVCHSLLFVAARKTFVIAATLRLVCRFPKFPLSSALKKQVFIYVFEEKNLKKV